MAKHLIRGLLLLIVVCQFIGTAVADPLDASPVKKTQPQQGGAMVFSIAPVQAEPGTQVVVTIGGMVDGVRIFLGGDELSSQKLDPRRIAFTVPFGRTPGQYALAIKAADGITRSYSFTIQPIKPVAVRLEPDRITSCKADMQDIVVYGRNFIESSQVVFDGAIIQSKYLSSEAISFVVPKVPGGLHQVTVKNSEEIAAPLGFMVVTAPVVNSVSLGEDRVSSYDLVIEGNNFQQNSIVIADGVQVDAFSSGQTGQLSYIDCNRIIYQRRPFSSTKHGLRIQVVNPGGETSQITVVSAP